MNTAEATPRDRSLIPPLRVWIVVTVSVIGAFVVRQMEMDMAIVSFVSWGFLAVGFASLFTWFCFSSPFPLAARMLPLVGLIVAGSIFFSRYELVGVDGSMIPKFVKRGAERHDELLEDLTTVASTGDVDVTQTTANDFPQFLGPNANSTVDTVAIDPKSDWKKSPPERLWQRDVGAAWSGFSAVNGFAFTMEQRGPKELVTCYRIEDGEPCWAHAVESLHETVMGARGPRATPTVVDGRVYASGASGVVRCLDGSTGDEIWLRDLFADYEFNQERAESAVAWGRSASAVVRDGVVYVPLGGPADGKKVSLLALNAENGETIWETGSDQVSYATPAILNIGGEDQIVLVNESNVVAYAIEDGEELWSHPWPGKSNMNASVSQPHVFDGDFVFLSKGYGHGAELLEVVADADGWTVESIWKTSVLKTKFSNVAIKDGIAFGLDDGILSAVDVETGDKLWKKGRYKYGQILLVGDHLLVMGEDGELALVEASADRFKEVTKFQALNDTTWNTICLYGDLVLVRNGTQAACYRLKLAE